MRNFINIPKLFLSQKSFYSPNCNLVFGYGDNDLLLKINPEDALALDIADSEIVKVSSRRGATTAKARVTSSLPLGLVSMTFHFAESPTNVLTN